MSGEWTTAPLRELCTLINGRAFKRDELLDSGNYPVLRVGNFFTSNHWYFSDLELPEDKYCESGDLLYAWSASFGPRVWSGARSIYHYHIWKVVPDLEKVSKQFLFYFLQWDAALAKSEHGAGTTMTHVSMGSMYQRMVPVPPLAEQQRIVGILDEAFEGIAIAKANAEAVFRASREIFENRLEVLFADPKSTWEKLELEAVLEMQPQNGWSPPAANHSQSGTPVLTLSAVTGFTFRPDMVKYTSASVSESRSYWVQNGDLLITRSNTPQLVGHVAIAERLERPTIYPDLIMRMRPDRERVDTRFMYYQLRSRPLRRVITDRAQGANPTMKKISNGAVRSLPIVLPHVDLQRAIVRDLDELLERVDALKVLYESKLAALNALKESLLYHAFTGQL